MNQDISEKEYILLTLLIRNGEMFGLDIVETCKGQLKVGTAYTTLYRMEDKGYVSSREEEGKNTESGIPRVLYKATPLGEELRERKRNYYDQFMSDYVERPA